MRSVVRRAATVAALLTAIGGSVLASAGSASAADLPSSGAADARRTFTQVCAKSGYAVYVDDPTDGLGPSALIHPDHCSYFNLRSGHNTILLSPCDRNRAIGTWTSRGAGQQVDASGTCKNPKVRVHA